MLKIPRSINGTGIIIPVHPKPPSRSTICDDLKKKIDHLQMMINVGEYYPIPSSVFWNLHITKRNFILSREKNWYSFWYKYRGCEKLDMWNKDRK